MHNVSERMGGSSLNLIISLSHWGNTTQKLRNAKEILYNTCNVSSNAFIGWRGLRSLKLNQEC